MPGLYPAIEPYDCGILAVGDGNEIYWEMFGNPAGRPGGAARRARQRVVRATRRNSTRRPTGSCCSTSATAAAAGGPTAPGGPTCTQHHGICSADIELLARHLGIADWICPAARGADAGPGLRASDSRSG